MNFFTEEKLFDVLVLMNLAIADREDAESPLVAWLCRG
jgi:hypothetical protein